MKKSRELKPLIVVLLLCAAVTVALLGTGCFGGGDDDGATTLSSVPAAGDASSTLLPADQSVSGEGDELSTFNSKDPFIPQAQLVTTTTRLTTTTLPRPTTTRAPTTSTTRLTTTTTLVHRLTVTAFWPAETISFTLDGLSFANLPVGPVLGGGWGTIEIMAVNVTTAPYTATFRRNGSIDFSLQLNAAQTW